MYDEETTVNTNKIESTNTIDPVPADGISIKTTTITKNKDSLITEVVSDDGKNTNTVITTESVTVVPPLDPAYNSVSNDPIQPPNNGVDPSWASLQPQDFPPNDELQDPAWLQGNPAYEFYPTGPVGEPSHMDHTNDTVDIEQIIDMPYTEGRLGNDPTEHGLERYNKIIGYSGITLGELLQTGWEWGYESYQPYTMSEDCVKWLRPRINNKINNRFYFRDLGVSPVGYWKKLFQSRLIEILDDLGPLYMQVFKELDILDGGMIREKTMVLDSDFPQARINPVQKDYASDSTETFNEKVSKIPQLDQMIKYQQQYLELDQLVLDHVGICFSNFIRHTNFF